MEKGVRYATEAEMVKLSENGPYHVEKWVRDGDLEHILNSNHKNGWWVDRMFRNAPGADKLETTTIIFKVPGL